MYVMQFLTTSSLLALLARTFPFLSIMSARHQRNKIPFRAQGDHNNFCTNWTLARQALVTQLKLTQWRAGRHQALQFRFDQRWSSFKFGRCVIYKELHADFIQGREGGLRHTGLSTFSSSLYSVHGHRRVRVLLREERKLVLMHSFIHLEV